MIPCPHCKERLEAKWFKNHLKNCPPRGEASESEAERDDTLQKRMEAEGDFGPQALTAWEKRLLREGKTFAKKGRG